jgi:hypothetical protein
MWLWDNELRRLGFRRKSDRYWRCDRRFGLGNDDHLSIWSWSEQTIRDRRRRGVRYLVELTEFHVTFERRGENLHFYYHEWAENGWEPGGHTSRREIRRTGCAPGTLRHAAAVVAGEFIRALGGSMRTRARADPEA